MNDNCKIQAPVTNNGKWSIRLSNKLTTEEVSNLLRDTFSNGYYEGIFILDGVYRTVIIPIGSISEIVINDY